MKMRQIENRAAIQLLRKIAEGGMSVVYEGEQAGCDGFRKRVAVKMMHARWSDNECFMKMFIDEAKLVSDLVHENIVQIYQLGCTPQKEFYIVMELVEGLALHDLLRHHRNEKLRLPENLAVHVVSRIARGLAYAHEFKNRRGEVLGIVHRDVCPKNILITTEGLAKLTDFGVAKALTNSIGDDWLTGKIPFMSPEQAQCGEVTFRSDIYSLGAVLFYVLTGGIPIRPSDANPDVDAFHRIPVPWVQLKNRAAPELIELLKTALAPEPENRFGDMAEMAKALEYHIYKDGYGPTIQTVEQYLRSVMPELYVHGAEAAPVSSASPDELVTMVEPQG
jgi:serine/threonine protein kinase